MTVVMERVALIKKISGRDIIQITVRGGANRCP